MCMKKISTIKDVISSTFQMSRTIEIYFTYSRVVKSSTFEKKSNFFVPEKYNMFETLVLISAL